jgi:lysophospholipase L1-like esterase
VIRRRRLWALVAVAATWALGCSAGQEPGDHDESAGASPSAVVAPPAAATVSTAVIDSAVASTPSTTTASTTALASTTSLASTTTATPVTPAPARTSCTTVAHIGDSTSIGLFEPAFMPAPGDAMPAQYERVGVLALYTEVSGGRSTVETLGDDLNAFDAVVQLREMGYRGCWVVTLGTNDAANVAIGGVPDLQTRVDRMMFLFGAEPVLWVDAVTRLADGPYADANMQAWNQVLDTVAQRVPTLRVLRWSDVALDEWFLPDGIHYTSGGWAWRSHAIADALAAAFPAAR